MFFNVSLRPPLHCLKISPHNKITPILATASWRKFALKLYIVHRSQFNRYSRIISKFPDNVRWQFMEDGRFRRLQKMEIWVEVYTYHLVILNFLSLLITTFPWIVPFACVLKKILTSVVVCCSYDARPENQLRQNVVW